VRKYVTYIRVSTKEQGRSGLGLDAQSRDIELFLNSYSEVPWEVVGHFQDIGSGADNGRPELQKAIQLAKAKGAELLVAKLDRLSRKVSYLATLLDDKKLKLRVAAMPHADKFQLHIYAALAEQERDFISLRTKAALAAAKARGTKLGGTRGDGSNLDAANATRQRRADARASKAMGVIGPMRGQGMSLQLIAIQLDQLGIEGGGWSPTKVKRAIDRAAETERAA
jgi:DNA invertase Pin-like site-specific DNA recombinase